MADKWIQGAIKHPGALTAKAKAAGENLSQFMRETHKNPTTNREIALARRLQRVCPPPQGQEVTSSGGRSACGSLFPRSHNHER